MTTATKAAITTYPVTIDYRKSLDEMVRAGRYDYANRDIASKNFSIRGEGEAQAEVLLVHFDRYTESDDAVKELAAMGLEPARLEHATAYGDRYPDVQCEYPIVFLGSVWACANGDRRVPCLSYRDGRRRLSLRCWGGRWFDHYRFAAVRKVLPAPGL